MKKIILISFALIFAFSLFYGCSKSSTDKDLKNQSNSLTYQKISSKEAKNLMDTEKDYVILDVRTKEEFDEKHIPNAVLIPDTEIEQKAESVLKDKDRLILVYCRTGRRSALAAKQLAELGYTNVKDFGGIVDWQYETE